jgi:hypothetical protein
MDLFQNHPLISLLLWFFQSKPEPEPDEQPTLKRIDWSYNDFETQVYSSNTPPSEIYPAKRVRKGGTGTPPILRYSSSSSSSLRSISS